MGVVAALKELVDDIEEVLSARARGAIGGGLEECMGGLKGLGCGEKKRHAKLDIQVSILLFHILNVSQSQLQQFRYLDSTGDTIFTLKFITTI